MSCFMFVLAQGFRELGLRILGTELRARSHVGLVIPSYHLLPYSLIPKCFNYYYPPRACVKGLRNWFCLSVSQSVSQSVCPVKNFEISTFTWLNNCCTWPQHGNLKKIICVYLTETKPVHSSAFPALFYLSLVLSTILIRSTTSIRWRPSICGLPACVWVHKPSHSQDCEKLGGGLGMRLRTHLISEQLGMRI